MLFLFLLLLLMTLLGSPVEALLSGTCQILINCPLVWRFLCLKRFMVLEIEFEGRGVDPPLSVEPKVNAGYQSVSWFRPAFRPAAEVG